MFHWDFNIMEKFFICIETGEIICDVVKLVYDENNQDFVHVKAYHGNEYLYNIKTKKIFKMYE